MRTKIGMLVLALAVPLLLGGCFRARQLEAIAADIAFQHPEARFDREFSVSLGAFSLGLVKFGAGFVEEGREARKYMTGISKVQVAVYKVSRLSSLEDLEMPEVLSDLLDDDWEVVVKSNQDDERVWILYREDDDVIRDINMTVLDDEELVLLHVSGELNALLEAVVRDHGEITGAIHDAEI